MRLGSETAGGSAVDLTLPEVGVVSQHLDEARSRSQPGLGATVYHVSRGAIETLPQGDNAPLNQTLLQAPTVVRDSFGQTMFAAIIDSTLPRPTSITSVIIMFIWITINGGPAPVARYTIFPDNSA